MLDALGKAMDGGSIEMLDTNQRVLALLRLPALQRALRPIASSS